ncbi:MAG TPA: Calx-beta domain-containing protein, partial [Ardenticatenaceae bacterium]|nr:Calx-beta domain-containing protein [Ardenticatenaceae bacterium]
VVNPVSAGAETITNTVQILSDQVDGNPADNTESETTPIIAAPDLQVTKSDGGISAEPGGTITYTVIYTNTGNQGATGVVLTETVPGDTTFNAGASSAGWSCDPDSSAGSTCTLAVSGEVAGGGAGGSRAFAVTVVSPLPAGVDETSNTVEVGDDGSNGADATPGNNTDSDTTPLVAAPDLQLDKSDGGSSAQPGETITYTLAYTNAGNQGATGVVITETVPANTTYSGSGWNCDDTGAGSTCTLEVSSLPSGDTDTADFAVRVVSPVPAGTSEIDNSASIADDESNGADQTPGDNDASDNTPLVTTSDLDITKSAEPASAVPGQPVTYTLVYGYTGNVVAAGVRITDRVPAELEGVTYDSSGASVTDSGSTPPYVWEVEDLAPGEGGIITITGQISPSIDADLVITNTATIGAGSHADATPGDNQDEAAISVGRPRVSFEQAAYSVDEDAGTAAITITLDVPNPYADVTVGFATSDGSAAAGDDYSAANRTVTIPAGETYTTTSVTILDDALDEDDETVALALSSPTGAVLASPSSAVLTILDEDPLPTLNIGNQSVTEGHPVSVGGAGTTLAVFQVTLTAASSKTVTVDYETADGTASAGSDYVAASGTVTFTPGTTTRPISVTVTGDRLDEPNETCFVNLSGPQNAAIDDGEWRGTIVDDDLQVDDNARGMRYDGWVRLPRAGASGGSLMVGLGRYERLSFQASTRTTSITLFAYRGQNLGRARILVDGVFKGNYDFYSPTLPYREAFTFSGLPLRRHTIEVVVLNEKNPASSGKQIWVDAFRAGSGAIAQEDSPLVRYNGWSGVSEAAAFGGGYRQSQTNGDAVFFTVNGPHFTWITQRRPDGGWAQIAVDGTPVQAVNLYNPTVEHQFEVHVTGLGSGPHKVKITALGVPGVDRGGRYVVFDGYAVP